jgi:small-conductance mechanosensitive channel
MLDAFMDSLPRLILAIIVVALFYALSIVARLGISRFHTQRRRNLTIVAGRLASATILLVGVLVGLTVLAPSFRASDLIKVLGIGSVAIGFAFQNILQNFLAGILLLWSEPFRIDDQIRVDDYEGTVEEIQARATLIRTYDGRRVVIPNADLFTKSVTVNTASNRRRWEYDFNVGDVEDIAALKRPLLDAVASVRGVLSDPPPHALVMDLGDSAKSIKLRVTWWTEPSRHREMLEAHDRVLTAIRAKLVELGHEHSGSGKEQLPPTSDSATSGKRKDAA